MLEQSRTVINVLIISCLAALFSACSTHPPTSSTRVLSEPTSPPKQNISTYSLGEYIVQTAKSQLGKSYKFGGESPREGFDCSGLAMYSYQVNGIAIPRQTKEQYQRGTHIKRMELRSGDLVFFSTYRSGASHVGIYMGDGLFIHSPNKRKNVEIETLSNPYYTKNYIGARRYW